MRGTWDDLSRRLTGAVLALDLDDALVVGDRVERQRAWAETEAALERQGWERPWSPDYPTYQREAPLVRDEQT